MDKQAHAYELDMDDLAAELANRLSSRGYKVVVDEDRHVLRFETAWRRGAAYGEIGNMLYALVATKLREIEP